MLKHNPYVIETVVLTTKITTQGRSFNGLVTTGASRISRLLYMTSTAVNLFNPKPACMTTGDERFIRSAMGDP